MGPTALHETSHPKNEAMVKDASVTAGDSNPHSADQKHQSHEFGALYRSATILPLNIFPICFIAAQPRPEQSTAWCRHEPSPSLGARPYGKGRGGDHRGRW